MKRTILLFGTVLLLSMMSCQGAWAGTYSGGSGSSLVPYLVSDLDDLQELQNTSADWNMYFRQTATINASGTAAWDGGNGFSPVGTESTRFIGGYDGDGYAITGLTINRPSTYFIGFFGYVMGATITDLDLQSVNITGMTGVGGLVGQVDGHTVISGCYVDGRVTGTMRVGGCIGYGNTSGGGVTDCGFSGIVTAHNAGGNIACGGFIGEKAGNCTISQCRSIGTNTGTGRNQGGFVAWIDNGRIEQCYSTMNVTNSTTYQGRIGGFAGAVANYGGTYGDVWNCYATGNVTVSGSNSSNYGIGGFVGSYYGGGSNQTYRSYSTGTVSATGASTNVGGFSGEENNTSDGGFSNFWNTESSGWSTSYEQGTGETGKTTAQMKTQGTYSDAGWNFASVWNISAGSNDGYPFLRNAPLAVELTGFSVEGFREHVALEWETAAEIDNAGFHIWRSEADDGDFVRITDALVPAQGGPAWGAIYRYRDLTAETGTTYRYRLEDVDQSGRSRFHGPVSGWAGLVDIKLNGRDGPVSSPMEKSASVTVATQAGGLQGMMLECWIIARTPRGWYSWRDGWAVGLNPAGVICLEDLEPRTVLCLPLPPGDYIFCIAVDGQVDGICQASCIDRVTVSID